MRLRRDVTDTTPDAARVAWRRRLVGASGVGLIAAAGAVVGRLPAAAVVPVMVVLLAGIDLVSGVLAKSWAATNSGWLMLAGGAMYLVMFWGYGVSLRFGELSTITIGWVVIVTVGNMALDKFRYQVNFPTSKWLVAILVRGAPRLPDGRPQGRRIGLNRRAAGYCAALRHVREVPSALAVPARGRRSELSKERGWHARARRRAPAPSW